MADSVAASIGLPADRRMAHYRFSPDIRSEIGGLCPDNFHGIIYLLKDYALIAAWVLAPYAVGWWIYPFSVLMIGAHQRGISTILHDTAHGVLTRSRSLNFLLGTVSTAWPIFQRYYAYRNSHVRTHHTYLGRSDVDPDLAFFIEEGVFVPAPPRLYLMRVVILPMLGSKTWAYMKYLVRNRYLYFFNKLTGRSEDRAEPAAARPSVISWRQRFDSHGFVVFWVVGLAILAATGHVLEFLMFWIVPYLTSFHILGWFIELSEHCSSTQRQTVDVYMARNRRSRHIEKWLTGINNDHHHLDHHLDPRTPFWLLPRAHRIRLRDANYARHCAETGGLFQKGLDGAPSIMSLILAENRRRYASVALDAGRGQMPVEAHAS